MTQKKGKGRAGDDLAQLRGQLGRKATQEHPDPETQASAPGAASPRESSGNSSNDNGEKPRRITVDLDAERHRVLREFAFSERVKGTEVLRGLLDTLRDDPEMAGRVRERLERSG